MWGNPIAEVVRFLVTTLPPALLLACRDRLLQAYRDSLVETIEEFHGESAGVLAPATEVLAHLRSKLSRLRLAVAAAVAAARAEHAEELRGKLEELEEVYEQQVLVEEDCGVEPNVDLMGCWRKYWKGRHIKAQLQRRGLHTGGTPGELAHRLYVASEVPAVPTFEQMRDEMWLPLLFPFLLDGTAKAPVKAACRLAVDDCGKVARLGTPTTSRPAWSAFSAASPESETSPSETAPVFAGSTQQSIGLAGGMKGLALAAKLRRKVEVKRAAVGAEEWRKHEFNDSIARLSNVVENLREYAWGDYVQGL
eukprot:SAG31_NODE_463_length_15332_cov_5.907700_3_plen_308_part_00